MMTARKYVPTLDEWGNSRYRLEGDLDVNEGYFILDGEDFIAEDVWEASHARCEVCEQPITEYGTRTECLSCYTNSCDRLYDEARDRGEIYG